MISPSIQSPLQESLWTGDIGSVSKMLASVMTEVWSSEPALKYLAVLERICNPSNWGDGGGEYLGSMVSLRPTRDLIWKLKVASAQGMTQRALWPPTCPCIHRHTNTAVLSWWGCRVVWLRSESHGTLRSTLLLSIHGLFHLGTPLPLPRTPLPLPR